jgi:hypothetical protein
MTKGCTRIITAATLLTLSVTAAHAARQWQHLGKDADNNHFLYDKKTTKRRGDVVSGWVSKQYKVDEKAMKEKNLPLNQYHGQTWTLAFYEFDCKQNTMRALVGKENVSGKRVDELAREAFHAVDPNSLDGALLQAICKDVK